MIDKIYIILFFVCLTISASQVFANEVYQTKSLNLKAIGNNVNDEKSEYFYKNLLDKFNNFNSELTDDEYTHIYYGYSFQAEFLDKKASFIKHHSEMKAAFKNENWKTLNKISRTVLTYYPVNLDTNFYYVISLSELNKEKTLIDKYVRRWHLLQNAISKSGSGLSPDDPIVVISIEDEYHMLRGYFEFPEILEQSCCDVFKVKPSEYFNSDIIYFDISQKLITDSNLFE